MAYRFCMYQPPFLNPPFSKMYIVSLVSAAGESCEMIHDIVMVAYYFCIDQYFLKYIIPQYPLVVGVSWEASSAHSGSAPGCSVLTSDWIKFEG